MILENLCNLIGVSGYESEATEYLKIKINNKCDELYNDKIGNLICLKKGSAGNKNIVVSAHVDEVGFQVLKKFKDKYRIKTLGNIKTWNAVNQQVKSKTSTGIIYAENYQELKTNNYENLYLVPIKGIINVGDVFTFDRNFIEGEEFFCAKSLDNRASCYCLYELIMSDISTLENIFYVFTVQEETTMRGSRVAKTNLKPDLYINLDLSPENEMNSIKTGEGAAIKISDSMGFSSFEYVKLAEKTAKENKIKYQLEVSDCGTSELIISNEFDNGGKELGISIPCKNIHSANTLINKKDLSETIEFMKKFLRLF